MFKKLLNVGKGHSAAEKLQQQQQQQKNLFQFNEIKSYGFSHLCCLGYSPSLSLIAVGSKQGLLRILGNPSVEFSYQLESGNSIRQIEFVDTRENSHLNAPTTNGKSSKKSKSPASNEDEQVQQTQSSASSPAKIVVLTDNCQLHLFELRNIKQQNYSDNTTQTDGATNDCCQQPNSASSVSTNTEQASGSSYPLEYTKLERVGILDYFKFKPEDDDRSRRVTTLEISADGQFVFVGTEGGNLYKVTFDKFDSVTKQQLELQHQQQNPNVVQTGTKIILSTNDTKNNSNETNDASEQLDNHHVLDEETTAVNLNDEPQIEEVHEPFEMIKFDEHVAPQLADEIKSKKQGAIESIKRHPTSSNKLLLSYHRGLNIIYDLDAKQVDKYFYHNQVLESSCFVASGQNGEFFYTSHNDGSYIKWDTRQGSQLKANEDYLSQLYGPYPCKPTPKIQSCTGLVNDQLEDLVVFSGGMPRATYDDKNPVTIVRSDSDGKDTIKVVLDFTSKVLDFAVITRPRGNLGAGAKSTGGGGGGGKKGKHKQQQQQKLQQERNNQIAVALAILAEEEFVVIDLLNSESYLEFTLPYLNCVHSSAITCNQHYSEISDELYEQLLAYNRQQLKGKLSPNEWPITGGKVVDAPEMKTHDILLTGHEDGSVNFWDVSELSMRHLLHITTAHYFLTSDDDLIPVESANDRDNNNQDKNQLDNSNNSSNENQQQDSSSAWPPLKRVGRFDPYSDDTRLAVRRLSLCPENGTLVVAGTGGQVLVFELRDEPKELDTLEASDVNLVLDSRFVWKGCGKLTVRPGVKKLEAGYQISSYLQLTPPAAATSLDLRSDWHLYAVGTSYGFVLFDYASNRCCASRCTLNVQDFAIVSGDAALISRKKSFRKSLRESFRRLRRGRSQRNVATTGTSTTALAANSSPASANDTTTSAPIKPAFSRLTTGVRTLNAPSLGGAQAAAANQSAIDVVAPPRNIYSTERQVEQKVELSSIVKCLVLTESITNNMSFKPTLWVGTNSGQVLVYAIYLATGQANTPTPTSGLQQSNSTSSTAPTSSATGETVSDQSGQLESSTSSPSAAVADAGQEKVEYTSAKLAKEIQLKHRAPIIAIFTSPEAPRHQQQQQERDSSSPISDSAKSTPVKQASGLLLAAESSKTNESGKSSAAEQATDPSNLESVKQEQQVSERAATPLAGEKSPGKKGDGSANQVQPRVLICSEEQFKVFNLPNLKPFCKFKLTANEGLRAKKISITQFLKPSANSNTVKISTASATSTTSTTATKKQQQALINSSKSLQSFATQTSPPASPVPPAEDDSNATGANGASSSGGPKKSESNNNSLSALNNNLHSKQNSADSKELMNAKFGASTTTTSPAAANKSIASSSEQQPGNLLEPYMVCMSNQGDCAIYSVPDLQRQAQIQVCKRDDFNGITSTMLTNYGEGFYLRSSSNFLRFSISSQRVLRVFSLV